MSDHFSSKLFEARLQQLVANASVSCTDPDFDMSNRSVIELLDVWLRDLGFQTEIQALDGFDGKYNLIASYGQGAGGLVLSGHTDTVPFDESRWQQDPFKLKDANERFYGLGATDMKGFFPTVFAALETIDLNKLKKPLILIFTADEESSMCGARALGEQHRGQRYAIIGEPTGLKPIRMHKGIMMESVRIQGLAGHSSNPALGKSALESMHQVLAALLDYRQSMQAKYQNPGFSIQVPTLNLGCIHGGDNPNRICGHCELQFDLRPLPGMDIAALHDDIERLLKPIGDATGTELTLTPLFPGISAYEEPRSSELVAITERLTGFSAESVSFATEAPFLQNLGMQTLVMGPGSIDQAHQPNEYIEKSQIPPAVKVLRQLIGELCL